MPANFWWVGGYGSGSSQTSATVPQNWLYQETIEDEIAYSAGPLPEDGDSVYFQGNPLLPYSEESPPTYWDCNGFGLPEEDAFELVSIGSTSTGGAYSKTVTLASGFDTNNYTQASGKISQPTVGRVITVFETFTFVGGTLNSSNYLSNVILDGAVASIAPTDGESVELGSNLLINNETALTIAPGTIDAHNDPDFETDGTGCNVEVDTYGVVSSVAIIGVKQINLESTDELSVYGNTPNGGTLNAGNTPLRNKGGKVTFSNNLTATFGGAVDLGGGVVLANTPYYQSGAGAKTYIHNGSTVVVGSGKKMQIEAGHLSTLFNSGLTDSLTAQIATISGNLQVFGGDVVICDTSSPHKYGVLSVTGSVVMAGGTYRPVVKVDQSGHCDLWKAGTTFSVNPAGVGPGTAALAPGQGRRTTNG